MRKYINNWFLIAICLHLIKTAYGAQRITTQPTDLTVVVGETALFSCSVADKKGFVTWLKDSQPLNFDTLMTIGDSRFSIVTPESGVDYHLQITDVTFDDQSTLQCTVTRGGGDSAVVSDEVTLTVVDAVVTQSFRATPSDLTAVAGDTVQFDCAVDNREGTVIWSKDGLDITNDDTITSDDSRYRLRFDLDTGKFNLRVRSIVGDDAGTYACRVTAGGSSDAIGPTEAELTVRVPQSFREEPGDLSKTVGFTAVFTCAVDDKEGTLIWSKEGVDLSNDETVITDDSRVRIVGDTDEGEYRLRIGPTVKSDAGTYACRVTAAGISDAIGPVEATLTMKDQQSFITQPEDVSADEGQTVTLFCSIQQKTGTLSWTLDGETLNEDRTMVTSDPAYSIDSPTQGVDYNLVISNIELSHAGAYVCTVTGNNVIVTLVSEPATVTVVRRLQRFLVVPEDQSVLVGSLVEFQCTVEDKGGVAIWSKDGVDLTNDDSVLITDDDRLSISGNHSAGEYNLQLNSAVLEDAGEYACRVTAADNKPEIGPVTANLTVEQIQAFITQPVGVTILEGRSTTLACAISDKAGELSWTRDGEQLNIDDTMITADTAYSIDSPLEGVDYNLAISGIDIQHAGTYTCTVSRSGGHDALTSDPAVVVVELRQTFLTEPTDTQVVEGDVAQLSCSVENRRGIVSWVRDGVVISENVTMTTSDSRLSISSGTAGQVYDLQIQDVSLEDAAEYRCTVSAAGENDAISSQVAILTVFDLQIQSFKQTPEGVSVVEGVTVSLSCVVDHREGTVIWSRDGDDITNDVIVNDGDSRYSVVGIHSNGEYELLISDVVPEDAGLYQCRVTEADNSPEIQSPPASLQVEGRQSFLEEPSDTTAVEGENAVLRCSVENKHGVASWQKGDAILTRDTRTIVSDPRFSVVDDADGVNFHLQISGVTLDDAGSYKCYVSEDDSVGDEAIESRSAALTVYDAEIQSFIIVPEDTDVLIGHDVTLACQVDHIEGNVIWSKDGFSILLEGRKSIVGDSDQGEYSLHISGVTATDSGSYECRVTSADNSPEITSPTVTLNVEEPQNFTKGPASKEVVEGGRVTIACTLDVKHGDIYLLKDGVPLTREDQVIVNDTRLRVIVVNPGKKYNFKIEDIRLTDDGFYSCYLSEGALGDPDVESSRGRLTVFDAAVQSFLSEPVSTSGVLTTTILLACVVDHKEGTLVWYKDGAAISSDRDVFTGDARYSVVGDQIIGEYNLQITNVSSGDAGDYQCQVTAADNSEELVSSEVAVTIEIPQSFVEVPVSRILVEGDVATFECSVANKHGTLSWRKDGVIISTDMDIIGLNQRFDIVTADAGVEYDLEIRGVILDDEGSYSCYVSEAVNGDSAIESPAANLTVYDAAIQLFSSQPEDTPMVESGTLILSCVVIEKEGTLFWSKDGIVIGQDDVILEGDSRYSIIGNYSIGEYKLQITNISLEDAGDYVCRVTAAENSPEIRSEVATVTVEEQQFFMLEPVDTIAVEQGSTILQCSVTNKHGVVSWQFNNVTLSSDTEIIVPDVRLRILSPTPGVDYYLNIDNLELEDAGNYSCHVTETANGDRAIDSQVAELTVYDVEVHSFFATLDDTLMVVTGTLTLSCVVVHKEGTVVWSKDGVDISNDDVMVVDDRRYSITGDHILGEYMLRITNISRGDAGDYVCTVTAAENSPEIRSEVAIVTVEEQQSFMIEPVDTVAVEEDSLTLQCSVNNKHGVLSWRKNDVTLSSDLDIIVPDPRLRILSPTPDIDYNLHIENLDLEDAGNFSCHVTGTANGDRAIDSRAAELIVYDIEVHSFFATPDDTLMVVSGTLRLNCVIVHQEGTVIWSQDGVDISSDDVMTIEDSRYSITGDHILGEYNLEIANISRQDAGAYVCRVTAAENSPEIRSEVATVIVEEQQSFMLEPIDVIAVEEDSISLQCSVNNKHGVLSWRKNDVTLSNDLDITVSDGRLSIRSPTPDIDYNLHIENLELEDAGNYSCHVTATTNGDRAIDSRTVQLTVYDIEVHSFFRTPDDTLMVISGTLQLDCVVIHQEGTVIWSKDGVDISSDGALTNGDSRYSIVGDNIVGEYKLEITNISREDAGDYVCRVTAGENSPEIRSEVATVIVEEQQSFMLEPVNTIAVEEDSLTLQCSVKDKHGVVSWRKDDATLSSDADITVSDRRLSILSPTPGIDYYLNIDNLELEDAGNYSCHVTATANGDRAIESRSAGLTVYDVKIHSFFRTPEDTLMVQSGTLILGCAVTHKEGTVIWSKDGVDISDDGAVILDDSRYSVLGDELTGEYSLQVLNISHADAGDYVCRVTAAENENSPEIRSEVATVVVEDQQSFMLEPVDVIAVEEDSATLQCSINNKHGVVSWKKHGVSLSSDGDIIVPDPSLSIVSPTPGIDFNLRIEDLELEDAGNYSCHVTGTANGDRAIDSRAAELTVYDIEVHSFFKTPDDTLMVETGTLILNCVVIHKEGTVVWSKDGVDISSDDVITVDSGRYSIIGDHIIGEFKLEIQDIGQEDAGDYICRVTAAENSPEIRSEAATVIVEEQQSFMLEPADVISVEEGSATLQCSVNDKHGVVSWEKNDVTLSSDTDIIVPNNRFSILSPTPGIDFNLQIEDLSLEDAGNYSCHVTETANGDRAINSRAAKLTVYDIEVHSFFRTPDSTLMVETGTLTLNCVIIHKEGTVVWSKDGADISSDDVMTIDEERYSVVGDHVIGEYKLEISDIRFSDAGDYVCRVTAAENSPEIRSDVATVTVEEQQTFMLEPVDATAVEKGSATIQCSVNNKHGIVSWQKDDVTLSSDTDIIVPDSHLSILSPTPGIDYNLHIEDLRMEDNGKYSCHVTATENGDRAIDSQEAHLTVYDFEVHSFFSTPDDTLMVESGTLTLACVIASKEGTVIWSKDGVDISSDDVMTIGDIRYSITGDHVLVGEYMLRVDDIRLDDAGDYVCRVTAAENSPEIRSEVATVIVEEQQTFLLEPVDVIGVEERSATILCSVNNKHGVVSWRKDDVTLSSDMDITVPNSRLSILSPTDGIDYNLHIENLEMEDAGNYSCHVAGTFNGDRAIDSQEAYLTVYDAEVHSFFTTPEDTPMVVTGTLSLDCGVNHQEGTVVWSKDGVDISADDVMLIDDDRYSIMGNYSTGEYKLQINNVFLGDAGDFVCNVTAAENSPEISSGVAMVTVAEQQSYRVEPSDVEAVEEGTATIQCSVNNKHGIVSWLKNNILLSSDLDIIVPDSRLTVLSPTPGVDYNLRITNLELDDAGIYACYVSETPNGAKALRSDYVQLTVFDIEVHAFVSTPEDTTMVESGTLRLNCDVIEKEGVVIWSRDGIDISNDDVSFLADSRYSIVGDHIIGEFDLEISNISKDDAGDYGCRVTAAENSPEIYSDIATVIVEDQQSFKSEPTDLIAVEEGSIVIGCSVNNKHGVLSWKKDDVTLTSDMDITVANPRLSILSPTPDVDFNLLISNLQLGDAGKYSCHVGETDNGAVAIHSREAELIVYDIEIHSFVSTPEDTLMVESGTLRLNCDIAHKEGLVMWIKDGVDISGDDVITVNDSRYSIIGNYSLGEYPLQISDISHEDAGEYICKVTAAENSPEIQSEAAIVTVADQQSFRLKPTNLTAVETGRVTLPCSVNNKHGVVSWQKDDVILSSDMDIVVSNSRLAILSPQPGTDYYLHIENVEMDDAGKYSCHVTETANGAKRIDSEESELTVFDLAVHEFISEPEDQLLAEGGDVVLLCLVTHKEGTVIWSKDGVDISSDDVILNGDSRYSITGNHSIGEYILQITNSSVNDSGVFEYRVTASDNSPEIRGEQMTITIRGPESPDIAYPICTLSTDNLRIGESVTLICESKGGDPPATLEWTKDGDLQQAVAVSNGEFDRLGLTLTVTEDMHNAVFVCSSDHPTFQEPDTCQLGPLEVDSSQSNSADIFLSQNQRDAVVGQDVTMECAVPNKRGLIHWVKDNDVISTDEQVESDQQQSSRYDVVGDHPSGEYNLQISDVRKRDSGSYYCLLNQNSEFGTPMVASRSMTLNVGDPVMPDDGFPVCEISSENLIIGDTAVLTCYSQGGTPPATLEWDQDGLTIGGVLLDVYTATLQVNVTSDLEGAVFTCTSTHMTFTTPRNCTIGPIDVTAPSSSNAGTIAFWVTLSLLIVAVIAVGIIVYYCVWKRREEQKANPSQFQNNIEIGMPEDAKLDNLPEKGEPSARPIITGDVDATAEVGDVGGGLPMGGFGDLKPRAERNVDEEEPIRPRRKKKRQKQKHMQRDVIGEQEYIERLEPKDNRRKKKGKYDMTRGEGSKAEKVVSEMVVPSEGEMSPAYESDRPPREDRRRRRKRGKRRQYSDERRTKQLPPLVHDGRGRHFGAFPQSIFSSLAPLERRPIRITPSPVEAPLHESHTPLPLTTIPEPHFHGNALISGSSREHQMEMLHQQLQRARIQRENFDLNH
ncbi:obscurin-like [Ptychodera flava]|uniref:obscurin-like n=1 Tax=Ptychodera flava TaxID=63121 RepID=UPI00396A4DCA